MCTKINPLHLLWNKVSQRKSHWVFLSFLFWKYLLNHNKGNSRHSTKTKVWSKMRQTKIESLICGGEKKKKVYIEGVESYLFKRIWIHKFFLLVESSVLQRVANVFNSQGHECLHGLESDFSRSWKRRCIKICSRDMKLKKKLPGCYSPSISRDFHLPWCPCVSLQWHLCYCISLHI